MSAFEFLVGVAMLVGLAGTILPVLPGLGLIMAAGVVWAVGGGAGWVGWVVAVGVVAIGTAAMLGAAALPARRSAAAGAPRWVLFVGALGIVVGFFVIPVVGALVGGPIAILLAEVLRLRELRPAWRSTVEALKGVGIGIGLQLAAGVVMIGVWAIAVLLA